MTNDSLLHAISLTRQGDYDQAIQLDDQPLPYYKRALELSPNHLWALHGVVTTFGDHAPFHQDVAAVKHAIQQLKPRFDELGESAAEEVLRMEQQLERYIRKSDA